MRERRPVAGKGLAGGALALLVVGVVAVLGVIGWFWRMGSPVDGLERLRELPVYAGATGVVVRDESSVREQVEVLTFEVGARIEDVYTFYDQVLIEHGWQSAGRPSDGGGSEYMRRDESLRGIEFTDSGFPWVRLVRDRSIMWLEIDAVEVTGEATGRTGVTIRFMKP